MPFLSVIIPVYNAEKYLVECFKSIRKQTFPDYEVIIIDDGSRDASPQLCDQYAGEDDRVKVFHVPNGGPSRARNLGFQKAAGEYIYCIDNDDRIDGTGYFQAIRDSLSHTPVDVLQTGAKYIKAPETTARKILSLPTVDAGKIDMPQRTISRLIAARQYETSCWTKVINREFLIQNKFFFDESLTVEDLDWNMRFLQRVKRYNLLPGSDYIHIFRPGSITASQGEKRFKNCQDQITVIKRWYACFEHAPEQELARSLLAYLCYQFHITLGMSVTLPENLRMEVVDELRRLSGIIRYGRGRRERIAYFIYSLLGFGTLFRLAGLYYRNFRTSAK